MIYVLCVLAIAVIWILVKNRKRDEERHQEAMMSPEERRHDQLRRQVALLRLRWKPELTAEQNLADPYFGHLLQQCDVESLRVLLHEIGEDALWARIAHVFEKGHEAPPLKKPARKKPSAPTQPAMPTESTVDRWAHWMHGKEPDGSRNGNYAAFALHFPTMTLLMECRFSVHAPAIRGEYAARRRGDGHWEILPTRQTFNEQLKRDEADLGPADDSERSALAEERRTGPVWKPMTPEDVVSMMETAYQRYIHSAG